MYATCISHNHQRYRIQAYRTDNDSYRFFNLLTSNTLFNKTEELLPEHRERLYPPTETLSMFLAQAMNEDRSCQRIVNDAAIKRLLGRLPPCSTHTGAYCRARQRLPLAMLTHLTCHVGRTVSQQSPPQWHKRLSDSPHGSCR